MRPFVLLIAVLLAAVMMTGMITIVNEMAITYNTTIPPEYETFYTHVGNESFDTFNTFGNTQVKSVEGGSVVTDATSGTQMLSGGFSFIVGLFSLPAKINSVMYIIVGQLGIPMWAAAAAKAFIIIGVLAGIIAIIFRYE